MFQNDLDYGKSWKIIFNIRILWRHADIAMAQTIGRRSNQRYK